MSNLLNNAAKYMQEGGRVWLGAAVEGGEAVIRVRDEGVGVPSEMLSRIFDLFTQVDRSLDRSEGGLGIGLALVVDDNLDAAESLGMLLELAGHEVHLAHDGEQALAIFAAKRPDVVLLDIGLPKIDGFEVARRLRSDDRNRGLLLVALTGYGKDEDRNRGRDAGFDHHLVKPVEPGLLIKLLAPG